MNNQKTKRNLLIAVVVVCLVFVTFVGAGLGSLVGSLADISVETETVPDESFAIINIMGTIQAGNEGNARVGYDHAATISYIDELMYDDSNKGIFLDVDSGGGTVYESDETYLKLMEYKEVTGRPVHAYFNSTAASGAYYIACAADYISANRNCWTGSIGVIISTVNVSGLYDKLGVEEVLITSGSNKAMGSAGSPMSEEHLAIYQSLVDEAYDQFAAIVAESRGYTMDRTKEIADGRIYSALQAEEIGLIDKVQSYTDAIAYMSEVTGSEGYYKQLYFPSPLETMFMDIAAIMPKSEAEIAAELVNSKLCGIPLYMYIA